jgi:hypothetical protein
MAAKAEDDLDSGLYGFGPTPYEQGCIDQVNGFLAAGSRPVVGAAFKQLGGAGFRSVAVTTPLGENINSQLNSGLPAVMPGTSWTAANPPPAPPPSTALTSSALKLGSGWQPVSTTAAAAPAGTGITPYSGPIYSPSLGITFPAGTSPAMMRAIAANPTAYGYPPAGSYPGSYPYGYPGYGYMGLGTSYSGGGTSSTGVRYGAAAGPSAASDPTPGGYAASSSYSDYGPSTSYSSDPDAFFGSNPSGMSQDDKAAMLEAYGASD